MVTPTAFKAVGMLGFSTPECSPVTTAFWVYWAAGRLVSPLAAAQAWSSPISCWMALAVTQPPLVQPIPGLVAVGSVESDSGATAGGGPGVGEAVGGGRGRVRRFGHLTDKP